MRRFLASIDAFQQRHRFLAFPVAVWRKFSDDRAGSLAALVAYYAFLSTFPLLLVLVTVLGMVLSGSPRLQQDVLNSALTEFPVIGTQLRANVHSFGRSGIGLAAGLGLTFLGARGVANAVQNAMNQVWEVPRRERPGVGEQVTLEVTSAPNHVLMSAFAFPRCDSSAPPASRSESSPSTTRSG